MKIKLLSFLLLSFVISTRIFAASSGDIVINEVAWMGTEASDTDEWLELYNNTNATVDVSGWSIIGAGKLINLSSATVKYSTIAAGGYLLIANDKDVFKSGASEAMYDSDLDLKDLNGDSLKLYDGKSGNGNLIDEVDDGDGNWFAGNNALKITMERIDPDVSGTLSSNWSSNDRKTINGIDAKDNPVNGTPGARNSVYGKSVYQAVSIIKIGNSPFFPHGDARSGQQTEAIIYYNVEPQSDITIRIFDRRGHLVKTLINSTLISSETGNVSWGGDDENGETVRVGVYIVHIEEVRTTGRIVTGQAFVAVGKNLD